MPDRVKSFQSISIRKDCPRVRLGFAKPIRDELNKEQNLIKNRPLRAETNLVGRKNGIRLQKEK